MEGTLGCPLCESEYEIAGGVALFCSSALRPTAPPVKTSDYEALRCSALLNLQGSGGFALLAGEWGALAHAMTHDGSAHLILVNPPREVAPGGGVSILCAETPLPLARGTVRGVAFDAAGVARFGIDQAAALVHSGGRLVAPVHCPLPDNATLLVSDERHWVAEVIHAPQTVVSIARRR
jgi:hypothetical protein